MAATETLTEHWYLNQLDKLERIKASLPAALLQHHPNLAKLHTRQRVWRPKVKTGCFTCRRRRIKCDEGKPYCHRCLSTDRKCGGYTLPAKTTIGSSWENHSWDHSATPIVIIAERRDKTRHLDISRLSAQPRLYAFDTPKEAESFDFFQSYSVPEFTGLFQTYERFWHDSVLPASMTQPAVRYAVTALGALHRRFASGNDTSVPECVSDVQVHFAIQQCNRSFQAFSGYTNSQGLNNQLFALVACILYICIASLQGHTALTAIHFRNGINLVNNLDRSGKSIRQDATEYDAQFASLVAVLATLETQARSLLCNEKLPACIPSSKPAYRSPSNSPSSFPSGNEKDGLVFVSTASAWNFFETLFNDVQVFIQDQEYTHEQSTHGFDPQQARADRYQTLLNRNAAGKDAIEVLLRCHGDGRSDENSGREHKTLLVVRLHAHIFDTYLTFYPLAPIHGEMAWDYLEPQFREMVCLSQEILECSSKDLAAAIAMLEASAGSLHGSCTDSHKIVSKEDIFGIGSTMNDSRHRPVFTFSHGTSGPLYTVAMKCREPGVRRQATALLLQYPRREGLWDSFTAGRIAWESIRCEEEMCRDRFGKLFQIDASGDIPSCCRIRDVDVNWTGTRTARVGFRTVEESEKGEKGSLVKEFAW